MPLTRFDHYTIRARDLAATTRFYVDVMGLRAEPITAFEFAMVVLYHGEQALVHLLEAGPALDRFLNRQAPSHADGPARRTGNLEHVAFNATGLRDFIGRLQSANAPFTERTLADYGVHQLLFEDPDGVEIEVNFPLAEAAQF